VTPLQRGRREDLTDGLVDVEVQHVLAPHVDVLAELATRERDKVCLCFRPGSVISTLATTPPDVACSQLLPVAAHAVHAETRSRSELVLFVPSDRLRNLL
jgi:hypothetical protein